MLFAYVIVVVVFLLVMWLGIYLYKGEVGKNYKMSATPVVDNFPPFVYIRSFFNVC